VIDIAGSLLALGLSAPIFAIVAVAIKLNSKGPVFYTHRRQGRHGKEFGCIKFRTMVSRAHQLQEEMRAMSEVDGPQFKVVDDPRVTLVGSFLRETNLDEIPQFLNVLLGQMSIVGPRPSPDKENQMCPAWREARLSVRPGISGLWQVSHSRVRTNDFQEWIAYDTEYVRDLSLGLDLLITAKTVKILLAGFARLFLGPRQEAYPDGGELAPREENGVDALSESPGAAAQSGMDSRQTGLASVANSSGAEARGAAVGSVNRTVRKGY
jgi:lipopolysaccharide/colanic/teichoic acid biosynthesis glycosyltransferase